MVDVSVVIATWNMRDMLRDLLRSVKEKTQGVQYEIIVVNNASTDGTTEMIQSEFPDVKLVQNLRNEGVARARNTGFRIATGRYILLLDADTLLKEDTLGKLVRFADTHPDAGIVGCRLVFPDGNTQPSCRRYPTPLALLMRRLARFRFARESRWLRSHEMGDWDHGETRDVDYVIGACQLIRREALQQVGELDTAIFYGPEDVDFCIRMYRSGWRVYYYPDTSIIHYEQRMTKRKPLSRISFLHLKGIIHLFWKYRGRLTRS